MSRKTAYTRVQNGATVSAATNTEAVPVDVMNEVNVYINVTAAGTTMTPSYQCSPDNGTTWFTHTTGTAITATGQTLLKVSGNVGKLGRISYGSVTGSFTVTAWIGAKKVSE